VTAAHGCATATRWLDYNDAWLGAEWVHPSDVVGAILPLAEYLSRVRMERNLPSLTMKDVVVNAIKAYEVVGILALENSLNQIGVDHIMMTRVAVAAVATAMLGGGRREVANAVSNAFADGAGCDIERTTRTTRSTTRRPTSRFTFPFLSFPFRSIARLETDSR
jgi:2-methylcitrate dehydratase